MHIINLYKNYLDIKLLITGLPEQSFSEEFNYG